MFPNTENSPFDFEIYEHNPPVFVYDMIYNPLKTTFLKEAEKKGSKTENGLKMLVYQAVEAEKIWFDKVNLSPSLIAEVLNECERLLLQDG